MKTLLSAVQPSNRLTLGNYLGALKGWVEMQSEHDSLFFVVDMHAITVRQDPEVLRRTTYEVVATYLAAGIDTRSSLVFLQSHVPAHAELGWILICFAGMGELGRMTQFKDKAARGESGSVGAGLFTYPALMAADILLYGTHLVPVGEDQRQHLELARDLALRLNRYAGSNLFVVPEAIIPKVGARVMSLQDPSRKMSKSDPDPSATVYLLDTNDDIARKIKRAVTDSGSEITYEESKPGVMNLLNINAAATSRSVENVVNAFAGKRYGDLKAETADAVVGLVAPIREAARGLLADPAQIEGVLNSGGLQARSRAQRTLDNVKHAVGFLPRWS